MKDKVFDAPKERSFVTCAEAVELNRPVGSRIFWRPGSVVNWLKPGLDAAEVLEA